MQIPKIDNLITYRATASKPSNKTSKKENYQDNTKKIVLTLVGLATLAGAGIYIYKRHKKPNGINLSNQTEQPKLAPPSKNPDLPKPVIHTEKAGNPRQLLNITDEDAQTLLSEYRASLAKYRSYKPFVERTKEEDKIASEYYVNVYLPLLDKIKTHNISVIEKKNFSLNPLEQVKEKHEYIHYEVLPCADFNEASFFDALEMFEKYGKREEFQRTGVSTLAELESSLPKNPTEASVTKLIKLYGKHADDFVYPDERDGAPNCITYEQNFLKVARKATTLKQARLVLENGRRMFWSDRNINKVADAWMVKDGAPLKGNEEVKKILDQMFACAAKNREPFMHDKNLVHEMQYWNVDKRYKF